MARPREFDEGEVVESALKVFWAKGFEATSIADLESATGLGRASLYAAFGDKETLFLRAMERYLARYRDLEAVLDAAPSVREGFARVFEGWLDVNCKARGPRGCLVQLTGQTVASSHPAVNRLVEQSHLQTERAFVRALERAQAKRELPKGADPELLARFLIVGLQGLSSAARGGLDRQALRPVVAKLLASAFS